jgi:hypothetical protein
VGHGLNAKARHGAGLAFLPDLIVSGLSRVWEEILPLTNPNKINRCSSLPAKIGFLSSEEVPMTIQVGMTGSDGIVLAGDTRRTKPPVVSFERPWVGGRYGENGTKIQISVNRTIAVSSALDLETAERIAAAIIARLDISDADLIQERIGVIANEVFNTNIKESFQCLVVVSLAPNPKLFSVCSMKDDGEQKAVCREWYRLAIVGDTVNSAIFWAERYYNQSLLSDKKPMAKLIPLCAHLIICARSLNTATISGLEMVLCTSNGIELLPEDVIQGLAERAEKREETVAKMIFDDE